MGFSGIVNKIVGFYDIVPISIVAVRNVLIKILTLRYQTLLCGIADNIGNRSIGILLNILCKIV